MISNTFSRRTEADKTWTKIIPQNLQIIFPFFEDIQCPLHLFIFCTYLVRDGFFSTLANTSWFASSFYGREWERWRKVVGNQPVAFTNPSIKYK